MSISTFEALNTNRKQVKTLWGNKTSTKIVRNIFEYWFRSISCIWGKLFI